MNFQAVNMPDDLTQLPAGGAFTLTCDTRVDSTDLQRFIDAGGTIVQQGYRLFISDPARIIQKSVEMMARGQLGQIPPWTAIVGAHPDGNGGSGVGARILPAMRSKPRANRPLKAGDLVYRVGEVDPPPDKREPHTWKAACVVVERASNRQVKLKAPLPGLNRTLFPPNALGRVFFETPLQAIQFFLTERRLEIESLDRRRKESERAIAWATSQEGMSP